MHANNDSTFTRSIRYDRSTKDYAAYLNGELVGFASSYTQAETMLDQLVLSLLSSEYTTEAAA